MVTVSGRPEFTNIFYSSTGAIVPLYGNPVVTNLLSSVDNSFILFGKRFSFDNNFYLSAEQSDFFSNYQAITSGDENVPTISGYKLDTSNFNITNDNITTLYFPSSSLSGQGQFTIVTANEAGWATTSQAGSGSILHLD